MSFDYHYDQERYWRMQYRCAQDYIIPFLEKACKINLRGKNVLEVGCGEGGVSSAFYDHGCHAVGMDISEARLKKAAAFSAAGSAPRAIKFITGNILEPDQVKKWRRYFDLVVMKDVIEHLPDHRRALDHIAGMLKPRGYLFVSFPPWYMPFGAHQQMFGSSLKFVPYTHLLPRTWFRRLAQRFNEPPALIDELAALYNSRLTLAAFHHLLRQVPFIVLRKRLYLFNPIYKYKFGLPPIPLPAIVAYLPVIREIITTVCYCTLIAHDTASPLAAAAPEKILSNAV
jgi:SAM-dependent methyltransferase